MGAATKQGILAVTTAAVLVALGFGGAVALTGVFGTHAADQYSETLEVDVDYLQFTVLLSPGETGDDLPPARTIDEPEEIVFGAETPILQTIGDSTLMFIVAREYGATDVAVRITPDEPSLDSTRGDVVEMSFVAAAETSLTGWDGSGAVHPLPLEAGESYRIRYTVTDADSARGDEPRDAYRVEMWPAPASSPRLVQATSDWMQYWVDANAEARS